MDDYEHLLQGAGLSAREAAVYLALMRIGAASPTTISKAARVKRSTIYNIVESLERRGFVGEVPKEKRKKYVALSPERIVDDLKTKTASLRSALPDLLAFHMGPKEKPKVSLFSDEGGIASVYAEITEEGKTDICAFLSLDAVPKKLWKQAFDRFIELYRKPSVRARELIFTTDGAHPYLRSVFAIPHYQGRVVSEPFFNDSIIYGDKVALFSFTDKFALVIQSKTIADSMRALFELAWRQAQKE